MLLIHSRHAARLDAAGDMLTLPVQDRSRWNHALIQEGVQLLTTCVRYNRPGPYQLQAAINAMHAVAEIDGPQAGLSILETLDLRRFYLFHAIRAALLRRLGRTADAVQAYLLAIERSGNRVERNYLQRQLDGLLH